jgi:hypothetical protein
MRGGPSLKEAIIEHVSGEGQPQSGGTDAIDRKPLPGSVSLATTGTPWVCSGGTCHYTSIGYHPPRTAGR